MCTRESPTLYFRWGSIFVSQDLLVYVRTYSTHKILPVRVCMYTVLVLIIILVDFQHHHWAEVSFFFLAHFGVRCGCGGVDTTSFLCSFPPPLPPAQLEPLKRKGVWVCLPRTLSDLSWSIRNVSMPWVGMVIASFGQTLDEPALPPK